MDPALLKTIVQKAHGAGLRVSTHVESAADFHNALMAGVDEINHTPGFRTQGDVLAHKTSEFQIAESDAKFAEGWLRTGDVAVVDEDGIFQLVDRTKDLVKSGGEWISSVELESLIMGHPKVLEACVVGIPHPRWSERPLACVVPKPDYVGKITKEEIIEYLRPHVAKWWLPDDVEFIEAIPKTSVGKFDKKVLRARY